MNIAILSLGERQIRSRYQGLLGNEYSGSSASRCTNSDGNFPSEAPVRFKLSSLDNVPDTRNLERNLSLVLAGLAFLQDTALARRG